MLLGIDRKPFKVKKYIYLRGKLCSLAAKGWVAEEPGRWDRTSACKGTLLQPLQSMFWSHLTHPDRWWHKSDRPWHPGLRPLLFSNNVTVLCVRFQLKYKDEGDRASGLTSPLNDAIVWNEKGVSQLAWSYQFFKDFGWWSRRGLNSRTPAQQTGALPTELTGRRETSEQLLAKIVQGQSSETTTTENVVAAQIPNSLGSINLNISGGNCNITSKES